MISSSGSSYKFHVPRDLRELLQKSQEPFHVALGFDPANSCTRMRRIEQEHVQWAQAAHIALEADQQIPAPEKKEVRWLEPFIKQSIVGVLVAEGASSLLAKGFPLKFPRNWNGSYILPLIVGLVYGAFKASATQAVVVKPKGSEHLQLTARAELKWMQDKLTWLQEILTAAHKENDALTDDRAIEEKNNEINQLTRLQVYFQGIADRRNSYHY